MLTVISGRQPHDPPYVWRNFGTTVAYMFVIPRGIDSDYVYDI